MTKLLMAAIAIVVVTQGAIAQRALRGSSLILDDNGAATGAGITNNRITITPPLDANLLTNYTLTLPETAPASSFNLLMSNASGQLSWVGSSSAQAGYTMIAGPNGEPTWTTPSNNLSQWATTGNTGLTAGTNNFLGTLDATALNFITNGTANIRMSINGTTGLVSVNNGLNLAGTTSPLQLNGVAGDTGVVMISQGAGNTPIWSNLITIKNGDVNINGTTLNTLNLGGPTTNVNLNGDTVNIGGPTSNLYFQGDTISFSTLPNLPLQQNHIFVGNANNVAAPVAPGTNGQALVIVGGTPTWSTPSLTKGIADPVDGSFTVTVTSPVALTASSVVNITHISSVGGGAFVSNVTPGAAGVATFTVTLPGPADASDIIHWTVNP
jgi:hypothetical protein